MGKALKKEWRFLIALFTFAKVVEQRAFANTVRATLAGSGWRVAGRRRTSVIYR
jgi:hypothetical protein